MKRREIYIYLFLERKREREREEEKKKIFPPGFFIFTRRSIERKSGIIIAAGTTLLVGSEESIAIGNGRSNGADDYVGAKSIYFIRCVNSGVARQKIMADRCTRRFGSGLKQSCKLMQHPSERAPLPVAINHHQLNYSHALPPHCFRPRKTRRVSSNCTFKSFDRPPPPPRDRYFSSIPFFRTIEFNIRLFPLLFRIARLMIDISLLSSIRFQFFKI